MTSQAPVATRPASRQRIVGIDLARFLALIGMMTAHVYAIFRPGYDQTLAFQVVSGRSSALFAVLAGVAVAIVTDPAGRRDPRLHRTALAIRAAWVVLIGIVLGAFDTGLAIILVNYGLLFLLALPFIRLRAGWLAALAGLWAVLSPALSHLLRPHLPEPSLAVPGPASLADPVQLFTEVAVTGYYPVLTWGTYLFAGMAIGRLDLRRLGTALTLTGVGAALAALGLGISRWVTSMDTARQALLDSAAGQWRLDSSGWDQLAESIRSGFFGVAPTDTWWWLGVWAPHSGTIADMVHTTGTALFAIGACLLLVRVTGSGPTARRTWQILTGAGTMALTLYVLHALAMALPDGTPGVDQLGVHVAVALLVGACFATLRRRGPLETLISYSTEQWSQILRPTR